MKELFSIEELKDHLTFKGGTSLSKVFNLIKRFSEDIDISIEKSFFGFVDDKDPSKASSRKAKKLIEELSLRCREYVQKDLLKKLEKRIEGKLGSKQSWRIVIDEEDNDEQTILFYYPQVTNKKESYIKPAVKIEIGARSEHWPVSLHKIEPYVANTLPDTFKNMSAEVIHSPLSRELGEYWSSPMGSHVRS